MLLGYHAVLLGSPAVLLGSPALLLGSPAVLLGSPALLLGSSALLLGSLAVLLGSPPVLLGSPAVLLSSPAVLPSGFSSCAPGLCFCAFGLSCCKALSLQTLVLMTESFLKFEGVLSLGSTSKHDFWTQGMKKLRNGGTKPRGPTSDQVAAAMVAPIRLPGSKPSNQKTLHLEDGRES